MNLKERTKQAVISYWMRYRQTVHMVIQQYLPRECKDGDPEDAGRVRVLQKQELDNGGASTTKGSNIHKIEIALERRQTSVDAQASRLIAAAQESACVSNSVMAQATLEVFLKVADVKRIVNEALSSIKADEFTPIYTVSSWFLHDCFNYLVERDVEALHYVTGVQLSNVYTLDRMINFKMSRQTIVSACGDVTSTHGALVDMEERGHKLHAYFHSHPGKGQAATFPSSIDLDYQARLEKGGYAAIGGIFSRDGYFRVFSLRKPFRVSIYGKGVERIDDRIYHLTEINKVCC